MNKYRIKYRRKRSLRHFRDRPFLKSARENDIFIPTLCYDERTEIYGACGLCRGRSGRQSEASESLCNRNCTGYGHPYQYQTVYLNPEKQIWNFFFPTTKVTVVHHVCRHVRQEQTARVM